MGSDRADNRVCYCLPPLEADAATQMALDIELLGLCEIGVAAAYVRFYRMAPPAVTIGRNQRWARVIDPDTCAAHGWRWSRRPTGGGALLHHHEINYAVAARRSVFAEMGIVGFRAVFARIITGLAGGLETLGLRPMYPNQRSVHAELRSRQQHGLCGRSLTRDELSLGGRKLVAAAQLLKPDAILQHGTIYQQSPGADERFWPLYANDLPQHADSQRWADLGTSLRDVDWRHVAHHLRESLVRSLGLPCRHWEPGRERWDAIQRQVAIWEQSGWHHRR